MSAAPSISVLMPTWQGAEFLDRVLSALGGQRCSRSWDFTVIDSGSTDGTLEILDAWRERLGVPFRIRHIHKLEFDHGDTRNELAAHSSGDLLVFMTQDAIPSSPDWLELLAANFDDPRVGAAYCRNVPRPDAEVLTRAFSAEDPSYAPGRREVRLPSPSEYAAMNPHARRLLYSFNDVASALRRELWRLHPFPRTAFGEDLLMARALLEAGHTVVYDDRATVEHSHDYTPEEMRERARIDGCFNAEWLGRICVESKRDADVLTEQQLGHDREALVAAGIQGDELDGELRRARALRKAAFRGLWEGGSSQRRRAPTRCLERDRLHVLYVVHGFPPDTWAGTEIYTLHLAREMQKLGHEVSILTRAPAAKSEAEGGPADFSLIEDDFEGLRVWRMVNRLEHRTVRDSYDQPRATTALREVLMRERPDLVHFQHLIHLSAGLVEVVRDFGLPTMLHCHDYWALCARVQLIRPNGVRCEHNQGSGCFLCIKERALDHIPRLAKIDRVAGGVLDALGRGVRRSRQLGEASRRRWEGLGDLRAREEFVLSAYAASDLLVSPSRFLRQKLLESGAFDPHTFLYSDNGMRTDHVRALSKQPDPEQRVRFGFVGSLVWYKGTELLLRAMKQLDGERAVLNVYGDFRPDQDEHHAALERLAGGNVRFKGCFDNQRLSEVYAEIDVLVVPSVWFENSPITIHEAFMTRTPVVASDIGGMAEYVRDGRDGLHFRADDAQDLTRVLRRFLHEPGLIEELSGDFLPVKTIEENAREMEYRYRGLCCRVREAHARVLLEYRGIDASAREGAVSEQGVDMLLLQGRGAAEYDIELAGSGEREIAVEIFALGPERRVELRGRALVDGQELGRIESFRSSGADESRTARFVTRFGTQARRLRLESDGTFLRIKRVLISERAAGDAEVTAGVRP
jgi:glycosyltransferase involved in cell wall biosynthesis